MKKFKLHKDEFKQPDERTVLKYKDFNRLRMDYNEVTQPQRKPLYKNKRMFLLLLLIAITAYAIYISNKNEKDKPKDQQQIHQTTTHAI